jgi:hypothetical protein
MAISGRPYSLAELDVGDAGRRLHDRPRFLRDPRRVVEIVPRISSDRRSPPCAPAAEHSIQLEVAAGGLARTITPGGPTAGASVLRNLVVWSAFRWSRGTRRMLIWPRLLCRRRRIRRHPPRRDDRRRFRHVLLDHVLEAEHRFSVRSTRVPIGSSALTLTSPSSVCGSSSRSNSG